MDAAKILPLHIFENILDNFNGRELKTLMCVNSTWYQLIASSCNLTKDSILGIRNDWINDERDLETIVECSRKRIFHKILISDGSELYNEIFEILSNPRCLKGYESIEIHDMKFDSLEKFIEFVSIFESTIKNLYLTRIVINEDITDKSLNFNMTNLKELKISHCDMKIAMAILQNATQLTSLEIGSEIVRENCDMTDILGKWTHLKSLTIHKDWMNSVFSNVQKVDKIFQLDELATLYSINELSYEVNQKFLNFLKTQKNLKKIYLNEWFGIDVVRCIIEMKLVKELSLSNNPNYTWANHFENPNKSIEILAVRTMDITDEIDRQNIESVLAAVPEVKQLKLRNMDEDLAKFIADNLKKISSISLIHSYENDEKKFKSVLPNVEF